MMDVKAGTPEYRKIIKKKLIFISAIFCLGITGIIIALGVIYYDIPQSEPAKLVTVGGIITSIVLCAMTTLSAVALLLTTYVKTRLVKIRDKN